MIGPGPNPLFLLLNTLGAAWPKTPTTTPTLQSVAASPFVRDTLGSLVGGSPAISESRVPLRVMVPGAGFGGPASGAAFGNNVIMKVPDNAHPADVRETVSHEFGHVFDFKNVSPETRARVAKQYERFRGAYPEGYYASKNKQEHFAAVFSAAVDFMSRLRDTAWGSGLQYESGADRLLVDEARRKAIADALAMEDMFTPGMAAAVDYLRRQPIYKDHPFAFQESKAPKRPASGPSPL